MSINVSTVRGTVRLESLPKNGGVRLTIAGDDHGQVQVDFSAAEWRPHQADVASFKRPTPSQETPNV